MDATSVNKKVREYLKEIGRDNENISINLPFYQDGQWYAPLSNGDRLLGTIVLDKHGTVILDNSYPSRS